MTRWADDLLPSVRSAMADRTLTEGDAAFVRGLSDVTLKNWNGIEVGRLGAAAGLRRHPGGFDPD